MPSPRTKSIADFDKVANIETTAFGEIPLGSLQACSDRLLNAPRIPIIVAVNEL
jgi:hypothetical protein